MCLSDTAPANLYCRFKGESDGKTLGPTEGVAHAKTDKQVNTNPTGTATNIQDVRCQIHLYTYRDTYTLFLSQ